MIDAVCDTDGISMLAHTYYAYLKEIHAAYLVCKQHEKTAAIHDRGIELQVYSLYRREGETAEAIRNNAGILSGWEESPYHKADGGKWESMMKQIDRRMAKHSKLHPILTRGVDFDDYPMLIHAYKFEPDPVMKIELVLPIYQCEVQPLPIHVVAAALRCLDFLVPSYIAVPLAPFDHHETKFSTILEYLRRTMPKDADASLCLS